VAPDGVPLAWYRWDPPGKSRGTVCLHHGHGEHAGRYHHVARAFARAGFAFLAFDARGHGRSGGPRGHSPSYARLLDDLDLVLARAPAGPRLLYGHSMGGQIVLTRLLRDSGGFSGAIITGAWLRLAFPAPAGKVLLARLLYALAPSVTLPTQLEQAALSRDPAVVAAYAADPLVHDRISFRLGIDLLDGGTSILRRAGELRTSLLLMHGEADRIMDCAATRTVHDRAGSTDKTLRLWPGLYHEIHNEPEWETVVEVATRWARAHVA